VVPIVKSAIFQAWRAKLAKRVSVGLDIGSSAVRAAEVTGEGEHRRVSRFAQVGLPAGAVVEGEVRDHATVAAAIKRLWSEGGFTRRDVVVGISSQRSMVRQVEMPKMTSSELRSALRFEMGGLLPIPVEEAVFDFVELGPGKPKDGGTETTQVLLVVAQREIVMDHINVVKGAGLRVRAVDSSPLALLRAFPPDDGGLEVIVSLGAQLVVVAVRQGSTPRFLRTVTRGDQSFAGARPQNGPAASLNGAGASSPSPGKPATATATVPKLDPTVEEVRGSLEYFLSYDQEARLEGVALTGGGALAEGVTERFARVLGMPVRTADIGLHYDAASLDLTEDQVSQASRRWGAAVGLAMWGTSDAPAISLIPAEIRERQQYHRALAAAVASLGLVAVVLGGVSLSRDHAAAAVAAEIKAENMQTAVLQTKIATVEPSAAFHGQLISRRDLATGALSGDIDWVSLVHRIEGALPPGVSLGSITLSRSAASSTNTAAASGASATSPAGQPGNIGLITMTLTTTRGASSVAQFVRQMWDVPGLSGLWVPAAANNQGSTNTMTFSAGANVTTAALSNRAANLPGAGLTGARK
jgi:type IV pilus assembly protein PilM